MNRRTFLSMTAVAAAASLVHWRFAGAVPPAPKPGEYHAVVAGAGLGGLTAAAYLARNGFKTLVVEQHVIPGGYATSFTRMAGPVSYSCEVSLHAACLSAPDTAEMLTQLGLAGKITPAPHKHSWVSHFPGRDLIVPAKVGLQGFKKQLLEIFPGEKASLDAYFTVWQGVMDEIRRLQSPADAQDKRPFPEKYKTLWAIRDKTLAQVMDPIVTNPELKGFLWQSWPYYGLPPSELSAFYYLLPTGEYLEYGGDYIQGTSQALSDALAGIISAAGSEVLTGVKVTSILVENGRAVGVQTADGKQYRAGCVICNAAVPELFEALLPAPAVKTKPGTTAQYTDSMSSFSVWLGLKKDIRDTFPFANSSYYPGTDPDAAYQAMRQADFTRSGFGIMVYDNLVEGFSAKGRTTVSIIALSGYEHWKGFEAAYRAGDKAAYNKEKMRLAKVLVAQAEQRAIPGLAAMAEMMEVASPLTNLRFTGNRSGAIYGYDQRVGNAFMSRLSNATEVRGLYLASAWGSPGGGYTGVMAAGKKAFKLATEFLAQQGDKVLAS